MPEPDFIEEHGVMNVIFYQDKWDDERLRKLGLNDRQIKAVRYVKESGKITNKEYQKLNKVSNKTAYLELTDLANRGIIVIQGSGKKIHYNLKTTNR